MNIQIFFNYILYVLRNPYIFQNAEGAVKKAIYETKIAPKGQKPNFMSPEEGMRRGGKVFSLFIQSWLLDIKSYLIHSTRARSAAWELLDTSQLFYLGYRSGRILPIKRSLKLGEEHYFTYRLKIKYSSWNHLNIVKNFDVYQTFFLEKSLK